MGEKTVDQIKVVVLKCYRKCTVSVVASNGKYGSIHRELAFKYQNCLLTQSRPSKSG